MLYITPMNVEDMLSEMSQTQKERYCICFHLDEISKIVKFVGTEGRTVFTRSWDGGECGISPEFQHGMTRKFWRRTVMTVALTMRMNLVSLTSALSNGEKW